jgi:6-hydroxynicotinate 3-monooxygenase
MASGAAMAIEDAAVLARCILETNDHAAAFALYEAIRMPRVRKVQKISAENSFLRKATDPTWVYGYDAVGIPLEHARAEIHRRAL